MRTEVVMPKMGESVTEGTVTAWLKEIGDVVDRDEPLFEITTDKVDAEVPSPASGILVKRLVEIGATVEIDTVVAILDSEGASGELGRPTSAPAEVAHAPVPESAPQSARHNGGASVAVSSVLADAHAAANASAEALRRARSTPLVRRIAAEHGISDLSDIEGSGLSGRVTKKDILAYIESPPAAAAPQAPRAPQARAASSTAAAPQAARPAHTPAAVELGARDTMEAMSPQRLSIARHMIASRATSAHAHTVHEVDFDKVFKARRGLKAEFEARGVKLTYTAFMIKAVGQALVEFPVMNSAMDGDQLVYRGDVNVGMAVALQDSLLVPVIRNVDELSLLGVARAVNDLAERARTKRIKPDEVRGGTFTVSNPGVFGSEFGVPIINQPQVAILATGAIRKRVVVDQKTDGILVRPTSLFCMSFDHRVIDGATADRFMARVRQLLEQWEG